MIEEIILKTRSQQKTGISSDWEKAVNFIPLKGEIIVYSDLNKIKIGDGKTNVNDLEFMSAEITSGSGSGSTAIGSGTASGENSTVIGTGTASGTGATVIGSGEASGTGSTAIGSGTATGDYSVAEGADTLAGCMGYYIAAIDPANNQIYLHTGEGSVIPTWDNPSDYYDATFKTGYKLYLGDANDNGILDEEDTKLILAWCDPSVTLSSSQIAVADINGDGYVSPMDATLLIQYLAGVYDGIEFIPHGNEFSISSDGYYHWVFAGNIVEISGNRITYGNNNSLNNTEKWLSNVDNGADPMTFFIPAQPNCGTTNVGLGSHAEGWETHAAGQHSHAEGYASIVAGRYGHAEGRGTRAGFAAHSEGQNTFAKGLYSHAEGANTQALASGAHAEGSSTVADKTNAHAEGSKTTALGQSSHVEGRSSNNALKIVPDLSESSSYDDIKPLWDSKGFSAVLGDAAHAEGLNTIAKKQGHAEGYRTISWGDASHSEGYKTSAIGKYSHVEGTENIANSVASHAEGKGTIANSEAQHVEGRYNIKDTNNTYAHIVGNGDSDGKRSNAHTLDWDGNTWFAGTIKVGGTSYDDESAKEVLTEDVIDELSNILENFANNSVGAKTENNGEIFNNYDSNKADGEYSHAEGSLTTAVGASSHAEGLRTTALGIYSHAEGRSTNVALNCLDALNLNSSSKYSDAIKTEWDKTNNKFSLAIGECAHAEGVNTIAGSYAHAEGEQTIASGNKSHAEGTKTQAKHTSSHAEGEGTITGNNHQHVQGKYNEVKSGMAHVVGWGSSTTPTNIHELSTSGNAWFAGNVTIGEDKKELATKAYVDSKIDKEEFQVQDLHAIHVYTDEVKTYTISTHDDSISFNIEDIVTRDEQGCIDESESDIYCRTLSAENSVYSFGDIISERGIVKTDQISTYDGSVSFNTKDIATKQDINGSNGTITVPVPGKSTAALRMLVADSEGNMSWMEIQRAEDVSV